MQVVVGVLLKALNTGGDVLCVPVTKYLCLTDASVEKRRGSVV